MMDKLRTLIREFTVTCYALERSSKSWSDREYLYVQLEPLKQALKKYDYLTPNEKLKLWKQLRWIDTDEGLTTARSYHEGRQVRAVKIHQSVYRTLSELIEKSSEN